MNASLFDRARAERFAQLMDEANGGRRHHARSRLDDELAELVATSQRLQSFPLHRLTAVSIVADNDSETDSDDADGFGYPSSSDEPA